MADLDDLDAWEQANFNHLEVCPIHERELWTPQHTAIHSILQSRRGIDPNSTGTLVDLEKLITETQFPFMRDEFSDATPLHTAAGNNDMETISLLLRHNHPIDAVDNNGNVPLHKASAGNAVDTIKFFVEQHGQPIDVKNGEATVSCTLQL